MDMSLMGHRFLNMGILSLWKLFHNGDHVCDFITFIYNNTIAMKSRI